MEFKPSILGFMCNWCSYAGADLAGVSRFQYPPNLRIIRVMCSARVDPIMVIDAFSQGADGIMILGCHFGDCHYSVGNYYAEKKMKMTSKLLEKIGINPQRLYIDWVSASEGERFANIVQEFTSKVMKMGPLGIGEDLDLEEAKRRLKAAKITLESETLRWLVGKERELIEDKNAYEERMKEEDFNELMTKNITDIYTKSQLLLLLNEKGSLSIREMSEQINLCPAVILEQIVDLQRRGKVEMSGVIDRKPKYRLIEVEK